MEMDYRYSVRGVNWSLLITYLNAECIALSSIGNKVGASGRSVKSWKSGAFTPTKREVCDSFVRLALHYLSDEQIAACNIKLEPARRIGKLISEEI